jgi:rod shape-determining protein MreC
MQRSPHPEIPRSTLALLAMAALLLTVWQHRSQQAQEPRPSRPEAVVIALGRPLQNVFTHAWALPHDLTLGLVQARALVAENARLKQQLDEKQSQVTESIGYYLENKALRNSLGLSPQRTLTHLPGRVIGLNLGPNSCRAFVQVAPPGPAVGDLVVQDRGLVGRVIAVPDKNVAEVMLLIDSQSAVAGRDTRSRDIDQSMGMIYPGANFATPAMNLKMEKLRPLADLREGDLIVTSGLDGVFAPNLPIGTVQEVLRSPASAESVTAVVQPFVDFFRLEFVYIVPMK